MLSDFYKKNEKDKIWWIENLDSRGEHLISYDKKKICNLFEDDKENPYWRDFFAYRK